ncbi:MAG TPA: hypothetical protein VHQ67_05555 [Nitrospiraceae bacterium]|jgi:hypothetical protein|nr:hypothetical protein [Nitrospiraceae bacterium]
MGNAATRMMVLIGLILGLTFSPHGACAGEGGRDHLTRAKVFLVAGDYRRALEACLQEVREAPSADSYVYVTYVYQAIDGYVDHLATIDRWVGVEQLYSNLTFQGPQDLTDPPDILARIAKEVIQESARKQSDVNAAMAARLDQAAVQRLWTQQAAWRKANPKTWWSGVPPEWKW